MNDRTYEEMISEVELLSGEWFPFKIFTDENDWYIEWRFLGGKRFTEPFYEDTMRQISLQFERPVSPIEILWPTQHYQVESIKPSLFIFHVSRCGSTLLTQMLSQIPENIVISEAPVIDQLLKAELPQKRRAKYVRNLINLLCKKRLGEEQKAFIKFDAWHLFYLEEIGNMFPDIPMLVLYRDPLEVLESHAQKRGEHMVPGFFDESRIRIDEKDYANLNGYTAKVIQLYFETILRCDARKRVHLLNYKELTDDIWSFLNRHIQISFPKDKIKKMADRARYHSKNKNQVFSGDNRNGLHSLPKNLHALNSLYKKLENRE